MDVAGRLVPNARTGVAQLATGIDLAYLEVGPADGKPLLLIHGLTDNIRSWSLAMAELHRLDPALRIFAVDLRGHGGSSMPDARQCARAPEQGFTLARHAADILAFMDLHGLATVDLAGHSLGSFIVQEIALEHPARVSHAILVATAASSVGNVALTDAILKEPVEGAWKRKLEAEGKKYPDDFYALTPTDADPNVADWLAQYWVVDPTADPDFLKPYLPETARVKLGTWIGATKALLAQDNGERLKRLSVPTLILWATQDSIYLKSDQDAIIAALTVAAAKGNARLYWKEYGAAPLPASGAQETDIGHNIQWAAGAMVAADIDAFIKTGQPTADLVRSASASQVGKLVVEPGKAEVIHLGH
ncbi:alpha/beta fold hydrolase [Dongia sp.]|uniref:alpha/beta fold hydrolase n=1 Tax=Dongia sp. TaxID=1977262 RepID=UPI0037535585